LASKQLGHGVSVMEKNYSGTVRGIDPALRSLEAVLNVDDLANRVVRQVSEGRPSAAAASR
jgi:hypothetical protein